METSKEVGLYLDPFTHTHTHTEREREREEDTRGLTTLSRHNKQMYCKTELTPNRSTSPVRFSYAPPPTY